MRLQKHDADCLQCCLSDLLDIPYEDIPEFYKLYADEARKATDWSDDLFEIKYNEFLESKGYIRIMFDAEFEDGALKSPYIPKEYRCIGVMKKKDRSYTHAVILNFHKDNTITWEDPKPNSDYEFSDLVKIELIVKGIIPVKVAV